MLKLMIHKVTTGFKGLKIYFLAVHNMFDSSGSFLTPENGKVQ
jgi:hypothetical protein